MSTTQGRRKYFLILSKTNEPIKKSNLLSFEIFKKIAPVAKE